MSVSRLFYSIFGSDELAYRALRRRAERHFRSPLGELKHIIYEALADEIVAIQAEQLAEQDEPLQEVSKK